MTVLELLEALDGWGLVITDGVEIESRLKDLEIKLTEKIEKEKNDGDEQER